MAAFLNDYQEWKPTNAADFEYDKNPYETFMRKHLQHYGYYTTRNSGYRHSLTAFEDWEKANTFDVTSESTDSDINDKDKDGDNDTDNKTQEELLRTTQLVYSYQAGKMVPKLREPRQLYGFNPNELGPQQAARCQSTNARWPAEIQVLNERIKHLWTIPPEPEPFYKPTGMERGPMCRSALGEGRIVYEYEPIVSNFFIRSRVGGSRGGCTQCNMELEGPDDNTLIFESRFESGNLAKAVQVGEYDYELWLRNDLYTNKHTQWYYFRIMNTRANVTYRFTIVNTMKPDSLYNHGMKPLIYSERKAAEKKAGWYRSGSDIKYYRNNVKYVSGKSEKNYYSLTWTCQFPYDRDTCFFAHCFPYTYSDLQDYIADIASDPVKSKICKQRVLCRSLAGNMVYVLTITSPSKNPEETKHRKAVVVTSRVHPGESNASWMMKGFLDYLMSNSADAKLLRDTFIFKIVPMLNPDGVIVGNYRCSLTGRDLNRNYKTVLKESFPSIWHTRNMIRKLIEEREVIAYCDLHGHSRKQNVFIYGCENRGNPSRRLRERIFPVMLGRNCPDKFSYESCKFKIQKSKEGTGRIVMWHMGIMNSYTMEATFAGSLLGKMKGFHFSSKDFEAMGYHFCDTLLDYCDPDNTKEVSNILHELEERLKMEIIQHLKQREGQELAQDVSGISLDDVYTSDVESSDGGSDSSVSDGLPVHLQYMADKLPKKKKRLKTKKERDKHKCNEKQKPQAPAATPIKYTTGSAKSKGRDEKGGMPTFAEQRAEERASKKSPDGYLEALTNAYIRSGILVSDQQAKAIGFTGFERNEPEVPHFRYTAGNRNMPNAHDAMCPHHEKAFAAQYVANHLQQFSYPARPCNWHKLGVRGKKSVVHNPDHLQGDESSDRLIMAEASLTNTSPVTILVTTMHTSEDLEGLAPTAKSTKSPSAKNDRRATQRHLVELSAAQQRQQDLLEQQKKTTIEQERTLSSPIKQHPLPFDGTLDRERHHDPNRRGFSARTVRPHSHLSSASHSSSSIGRVQSAKTLSVTSSAVSLLPVDTKSQPQINSDVNGQKEHGQRQHGQKDHGQRDAEDELTHDGAKAYKEMEHQVSRKSKLREVSRHHREAPSTSQNLDRKHHATVPSGGASQSRVMASAPSLPPPTLSKVSLQSDHNVHTRTTSHNGNFTPSSTKTSSNLTSAQNRNNNSREVTLDVPDNSRHASFLHRNQQQRKTSNSSGTHPELNDTIRSYNEIREALLDPSKRANLSPTTGQFIEHFVRKTDKEVAAITAEEELVGEANGYLGQRLDRVLSVDRNLNAFPHMQSGNGKTPVTTPRNHISNTLTSSSSAPHFSLPQTSGPETQATTTSIPASAGKKLFIKGQSETIYNDTGQQRSFRARHERPQSHHFVGEEDHPERAGSGVARIYMNDIIRRNAKTGHHSRTLAPPSYQDPDLEDHGNGRSTPPGAKDLPLPKPLEFDRGRSAYSQRKSPSKISLMITRNHSDHHDTPGSAGGFQGLNRTVRPPPILRQVSNRR